MSNTITATGFDGNGYTVGARVEIHPATDAWMRGAQYGDVLKVFRTRGRVRVTVKLDKLSRPLQADESLFRSIG